MPTCGDLKSGDSLFFFTNPAPPPPKSQNFNEPTPPPRQIDPVPNGNGLGHNMKTYMTYILSKFMIIIFMPK